jgi:hypothetical protein
LNGVGGHLMARWEVMPSTQNGDIRGNFHQVKEMHSP